MSPMEEKGYYVGQLVVLLEDTTRMKAGSILRIELDEEDGSPRTSVVIGELPYDGENWGYACLHEILPLCTHNLENK